MNIRYIFLFCALIGAQCVQSSISVGFGEDCSDCSNPSLCPQCSGGYDDEYESGVPFFGGYGYGGGDREGRGGYEGGHQGGGSHDGGSHMGGGSRGGGHR
jgi:hypothetical protein